MNRTLLHKTLKVAILTIMTNILFGCSMDKPNGTDKYDYADIELSGRIIVDTSYERNNIGNNDIPLNNIQITLKNSNATTYTNEDGYFIIYSPNVNIGLYPNYSITVAIEDIDGDFNGGHFTSKDITIPIRIIVDGEPVVINHIYEALAKKYE